MQVHVDSGSCLASNQIKIQFSDNNCTETNSNKRGFVHIIKMKPRLLFFFVIICIFIVSLHSSKLLKRKAPENGWKTRAKRHPDPRPIPDNKESGLFGAVGAHENQDPDPVLFPNSGSEVNNAVIGPKKKDETPIGFLPLPPGYNKLVIPLAGNTSTSIFIMVYLSIRGILDVDTTNGLVELDTELGITWIDWEIWKFFIEDEEAQKKAAAGPEEIILDSEFLKQIWKPDIFIEEMAGVERTFLLSKLITLRFLVRNGVIPGLIDFKSRQTFKVRCEMEFQYYPADTQKCPLNIRSYTYTGDQLFLLWNPRQKVFLDNIEDSNYDMQVSNVEPGEELYDLFTTSQATCCSHRNFSTLTFTLQLRRNLKYHLTQTCLPSILLILITWLCFLIPPDMVEARIGISMTTLLTLTAMFTAVREQSPQVSYIMAIDIWMVFCIFMLFIALVLFTVIYWMRRRLRESLSGQKEAEDGSMHGPSEPVKVSIVYQEVVNKTRKYAFVLFALIFIAFLLGYGTWLMKASEYQEWEPSSKYNAIPIEDDDGNVNASNRLFTKADKKFRANSTKKVVENEYRFSDIFKKVVYPKLLQLEVTEEDYEDEEEEETEPPQTTTTPPEIRSN